MVDAPAERGVKARVARPGLADAQNGIKNSSPKISTPKTSPPTPAPSASPHEFSTTNPPGAEGSDAVFEAANYSSPLAEGRMQRPCQRSLHASVAKRLLQVASLLEIDGTLATPQREQLGRIDVSIIEICAGDVSAGQIGTGKCRP